MMHSMRTTIPLSALFRSLFLMCIILAVSPVNPALSQSTDEVVQSVEKHYRDTIDLSAKVSQKNLLRSMDKTQKFEGTLRIKKPGKLLLEYANGQLILINDKDVLFYSRKSTQVIKKAFSDFGRMNIPVAFLLGAAHIRDDFIARQPDAKLPRVLELLPRKQGAAMKKLVLHVNETGRITQMAILDKTGNRTEIAFTDVREGTGLDDSMFTFTPPAGTEIIEQ
jgi:outer membrane lipoprotein carrier protein